MFTFFVSWLECNEIRFFNIFRLSVKKKKIQFENHNFHKLGCVRMRKEDISAIGK